MNRGLAMACLILILVSWNGAGMAGEVLQEKGVKLMREAIARAIKSGEAPGVVVVVGQGEHQEVIVMGNRAEKPQIEVMTADTVFDVASLTKVVATNTCVMKLVEQGSLDLEKPIRTWLPEFDGEGREHIKLRHLLTHTSGLAAGLSMREVWEGRDEGRKRILSAKPLRSVDEVVRYSDLNFLLLGEIVERVSGKRLNQLADEWIFNPLKMASTGYLPTNREDLRDRIAPTAMNGTEWMRGVVHDPCSRRIGGVTGHAGLFSSAEDLSRFARMLIREGELDGVRILQPETIRLMTSVQTPPTVWSRRGLGWDLDSPYSRPRGKRFPLGSFGHTGFTGVSMWICPVAKSFVIVLTSRLHPDNKGNVIPLQEELATIAADHLKGVNIQDLEPALSPRLSPDETPTVWNGIDVLSRNGFKQLRGLKVGLVTNHSGVDQKRKRTVDLLYESPHVKLVALFSPEHGLGGNLDQSTIKDDRDVRTGLKVFSLYGEKREPAKEQLQDIDALVFDIQDIGCRFYTYISTLQNCMKSAAKAGKKVVVLDRVNPIGGEVVEGPVKIPEGKTSFVGCHPIALRHGMTVGELAFMMNEEGNIHCDLEVIKMEGWRRHLEFDRTGLPWINPSPNMRNLDAALLYPGVGLVENALSVGRGTDTPFEIVGAPYVKDDVKLAHELNQAGVKGVRFVPVRFKPTASVFKNEECGGVRMMIVDRQQLRGVDVGMAIASVFQRMYPNQFKRQAMGNLLLHEPTLVGIKEGKSWQELKEGWMDEFEEFLVRRSRYLLYP